jgi:cyclomaltodextrinase / maltogenic alpha-amylase / neopullulanase
MKVKPIWLWLLIAIFTSCKQTDPADEIGGLASVIALDPDSTQLLLSDYFPGGVEIRNIDCPEGFDCQWNKSEGILMMKYPDPKGIWKVLHIETRENTYQIPMRHTGKKRVTFQYPGPDTLENVFITGEMNAWNDLATPLTKGDSGWSATFWLQPGEYPYLMVIQGQRQRDAYNERTADNGMGGTNSVLMVEGPDKDSLPWISTSWHRSDSLGLLTENGPVTLHAFWENSYLGAFTSEDSVSLAIPASAATKDRSFIRIFGENTHGTANDVLIPLQNGQVIHSAAGLDRTDFHAQVMYFLMVDRFFDGQPDNNRPTPDSSIHPRANFHGGDLAGIIKKIESGYFDSLGINTLWLSPIPKNPEGAYGLWDKGGVRSTFSSYHGYWPTGLSRIDDRFGTPDELRTLVTKAHEKGINVLLDFVAHHIHEEHPLYREKKDLGWFTDLYLPDGTLNTERWDDHRLTTWFDVFLPTFNFARQDVCDMLSDSATYWLYEYGIDGFRHDATKHIDLRFWRTLTSKVKDYRKKTGKPVYQVGETYGSPELIASYIQSGMLDAQFDFNVYDAAIGALCRENEDFTSLRNRLEQSLLFYGHHHLMGNMSGNQDKNRFMALATGDVRFEEDGKLAGWTRAIEKKTSEGYKKLALMHAVNLSIPGVPCIYYGDEIGMTGGNDPDNRRMMRFDALDSAESALRRDVALLTSLRRSLLPLSYGDFRLLPPSDPNVLGIRRRYFDQEVIILINKSDQPKAAMSLLPSSWNSDGQITTYSSGGSKKGNSTDLTLPPYSWLILEKKINRN